MTDFAGLISGLLVLTVFGFILVVIFLICRELVCWYWKINRMADTLDRIADLLSQQAAPVKPPAAQIPVNPLTAPRRPTP